MRRLVTLNIFKTITYTVFFYYIKYDINMYVVMLYTMISLLILLYTNI